MTKHQTQIRDFMQKAGQDTPTSPTIPSRAVRELRIRLIAEELVELCLALECELHCYVNSEYPNGAIRVRALTDNVDLLLAADATGDLRVVVTGCDLALGIDGEPIDEEIHRSNMSKFIDGHRREDGKWVKGPSYSPAQLQPILDEQIKRAL